MEASYLRYAARMRHGYTLAMAPNGTACLRAGAIEEAGGVRHGFSLRCGGVSEGAYESLNLSMSRMESAEVGRENFLRFCAGFGYDYESLAIINYEHGNTVLPLTREHAGQGFEREPLPFCDGLITNDPGVTLVTSHADCGVFFFYDPLHRAAGVAHAGWKGTLLRIGAKMVEGMEKHYGTKPGDILCAVGPCICRACYEVDMALAERFRAEFHDAGVYSPSPDPNKPDKAQLDLERAAAIQLLDAGLRPEHITLMHACTCHNADMFYSYRRDRGETGSMSGFIQLLS